MAEEKIKIKMNVQGKVQGVGFRYMTKMLADELKVTGGVWNEADGSVSIEAIGDYATLAKFIEKVKASPSPFGKVTHTTINKDVSIKDCQSFSVRN